MEIRIAPKKIDEKKMNEARKRVLDNHFEEMLHGINASRRVTEAEARKDLEAFKKNRSGYKPLGTFCYDELVFCKLTYGDEIVKDPDFWRFWRKANGQEFLKFA